MDAALATLVGVVVTGLVAALGHILQSRAAARASLPDQYKALLAETRAYLENQVSDLTERVESLSCEIAELKKAREVDRAKYKAALRHIRNWRTTFPDALVNMPLPVEIADDV